MLDAIRGVPAGLAFSSFFTLSFFFIYIRSDRHRRKSPLYPSFRFSRDLSEARRERERDIYIIYRETEMEKGIERKVRWRNEEREREREKEVASERE